MTASDNLSAIEAIEEAMKNVTPGPWKVFDGCSWRRIGTIGRDGNDCAVLAPTKASDGHPDLTCSRGNDLNANLNYIAACSPERISTLLAEARKAEAMKREIAELREVMRECHAALKMMVTPGDISGSTVATAFAAATSAECRARTLLNGGSDAQG